ncbi:MAG: TPM domain-containing protein [Saccharofermentans sp.]|nr:TPM domain-containing protein [Saccharofermentans sp.]
MPHSSGGGSHGGGGHGGGFGGGGRGGSASRTSKTSFPGARKYVYYRSRTPVLIYANYDYTKSGNTAACYLAAGYFAVAAITMVFVAVVMLFGPFKVRTNYDTTIVIEDNADLISKSEEKELKKALKDFLDRTGIAPAVVTVNNEDWQDDYKNLEKYSYDLYLDMFKDEKHWLIVYSEPVEPDFFNDWYWEGMQGDRTDSVLTESKTSIFNKSLQKKLTARTKYTVGEALTESFSDFNKVVMKKENNALKAVAFFMITVLFGGVSGFLIFLGIRLKKQSRSAFECKEEVIRQRKCNYCGGVYVIGHHNNCPHCQAQIPYEDTPAGFTPEPHQEPSSV